MRTVFTPFDENQVSVQMSIATAAARRMTVLRFLRTGSTVRFGNFMLNGFLAIVALVMMMTTEFFRTILVNILLPINTANRDTC